MAPVRFYFVGKVLAMKWFEQQKNPREITVCHWEKLDQHVSSNHDLKAKQMCLFKGGICKPRERNGRKLIIVEPLPLLF